MIALVGFMGSGKSTLAEFLAQKLEQDLFVTDQMVFKNANVSNMREVFEKGGENYLRELELKSLKQIEAQAETGIIDCGGGVITFQPSRKILQRICSQIIFLEAPFDLIYSRVGKDQNRPLILHKQQSEEVYNERQKLYRAVSTDVITIENQPVDVLGQAVMEILR